MPIYAKTIRDMCVTKPRRSPRDAPIVHVIGKLSELIMRKTLLAKYDDLGNPTIIVHIRNN